MWTIFLTTLHVIACIFLVIVVLLQKGKGSDVNAVFGGSSQTIFGSSGAGNFLTKLTSATAIVFMFTSLSLTIGNTKQSTKSVFDDVPTETTPATPEQPPATPQGESGAPTAATTSTEKPATTAPTSGVTVTTTPVPASPTTAAPAATTPPALPQPPRLR
jgi:preprotein translocase subunit SecG